MPSSPDAPRKFGGSVAVDGRTVVVGAPGTDVRATTIPAGPDRVRVDPGEPGAAHVFVRDQAGRWRTTARLRGANTGVKDQFGESVAIDAGTIVVGAPGESGTPGDGETHGTGLEASGAVYVFRRQDDGTWVQTARLKASNADAYDEFGASVDVSGDTIVASAPGESSRASGVGGDLLDNRVDDAGAAYVFARDSGGRWTQQAYLKAFQAQKEARFGESLAVDANGVLVGAPQQDSRTSPEQSVSRMRDAGAAYLFRRRDDGRWLLAAELHARNAGARDHFGRAVDLHGELLAIGAYTEASDASGVNADGQQDGARGAGAAYVFARSSLGSWKQHAYLKASNAEGGDLFGSSVAVFGAAVVVGARGEDSAATGTEGDDNNNDADHAGAAYVFGRDAGGAWSQQSYLKPRRSVPSAAFGTNVGAARELLVVGAPDERTGGEDATGAAHTYARRSKD